MTAWTTRRLDCDGPACTATLLAPADVDLLYGLRRHARERGWTVTGIGNDRLDYCPVHAGLGLAPTTPTGGTR